MKVKGDKKVRVVGHDTSPGDDVTPSPLSGEAGISGQASPQLHDATSHTPPLEAFIGGHRRDVTDAALTLESLIGGHDSPVRRSSSMPRPRSNTCDYVRASPSNPRGLANSIRVISGDEASPPSPFRETNPSRAPPSRMTSSLGPPSSSSKPHATSGPSPKSPSWQTGPPSNMTSGSSNPGGKIRRCISCTTRMSNMNKDPHLFCISCRGIDCGEGLRCSECSN